MGSSLLRVPADALKTMIGSGTSPTAEHAFQTVFASIVLRAIPKRTRCSTQTYKVAKHARIRGRIMRHIVHRVVRRQTLRDQRNLFNLTMVAGGLMSFWVLLAHFEGKLF